MSLMLNDATRAPSMDHTCIVDYRAITGGSPARTAMAATPAARRWESTMPSRRVLLAAPVALALPALADGKNRKRKKKSKRKQNAKAHSTPQPDTTLPVLSDLALHHVHSWDQEGMPIPDLVARYRAGEVLRTACGGISRVGVRVLRDAGYQARLAGVVTKQAFDGDNDGHIMLEVWDQDGWRLYDLDGNRRAVDAALHGVNLVTQVAAGASRLWLAIDHDPGALPTSPIATSPAQAALDQRVFGTPWIQRPSGGGVFHDATDRARVEAKGHTYVDEKEWEKLLGKP